ncbi:HmuY family protein [Flavobacterium sp. MR2016-29]|uniref:HmuY family protein n=1 Tax=Flavobacterium sp. MR2016-29 TaxID=2783795 RepID=UPI00188B0262|nr:HmuY family protein [Flavobacterium sp. MR2016-29]MBF4492819.1 HmuY family protein [Flavobacterium sp. MR2016-29]
MKKLLFLSIALLSLVSCSSDDDTPVEIPTVGATIQPTVGGPNQPNQVYLDLSSTESKAVNRESWDFGFSTGSDFRVVINGSLKMAVKKSATSDITLPQESDTNVAVGGGTTAASNGFVDNPTGVLAGAGAGIGTAIAEISATDADNKVYLVNLGFKVSATTPAVGSVSVDGDARGWKKVRILRSGNGYKIQYADLTSATFSEKTISKDAAFNFSFFSLTSGNTVAVEPEKAKWDLNFTVFTNYLASGGQDVTYGYSDFITTNLKGGTQAYQVLVADGVTYADFTKAKVIEANFTASAADQRIIGANWRSGGGPTTLPSVRTDRFYIVKDAAGNYYKVKFLAMTNDAGLRGYPTLEYAILN